MRSKNLFMAIAGICAASMGCSGTGGSADNLGPTGGPADNAGQTGGTGELGTIMVDGKQIPRLAVPAETLSTTPPGSSDDDKMLKLAAAFGQRHTEHHDNTIDYRGQDFANAVFNCSGHGACPNKGSAPTVTTSSDALKNADFSINDSSNKPVIVGDVAYFRPGMGGTMFSAAQIYLAAQHFTTVVLLYSNMTDTDPNWPTGIRKIDTTQGILDPVEKSCSGACIFNATWTQGPGLVTQAAAPAQQLDNVYAIGSAHPTLITYMQQSDTTLEQLEALRASNAGEPDPKHNPNKVKLPFNPFTPSKAILFAHSQGTPDSVMTNQRLKNAGLPSFAKIAGEGGASFGCRIGTSMDWATAATSAITNSGAGMQGYDTYTALIPDTIFNNLGSVLGVKKAGDTPDSLEGKLKRLLPTLIEYGFAPAIQMADKQYQSDETQKGDARYRYWNFGQYPDFQNADGKVTNNDGLVNNDSSTMGARGGATFYLTDHMGVIEDPRFMYLELQYILNNPPQW